MAEFLHIYFYKFVIMENLMFHSQENRNTILEFPIICKRDDAWLGTGYYFWYEEDDAFKWGITNKAYYNNSFQIYKANIKKEDVLDTVFNEKHYHH